MTSILPILNQRRLLIEASMKNLEMSDDRCYSNGSMTKLKDELADLNALIVHAKFHEQYLATEQANLIVGIKALREGARLPLFGSDEAAGADLHSVVGFNLPVGMRGLVPTGIAIDLPKGYEAQIRPRSGLALKQGVTVLNSPGTVDSDYHGEIHVLLINHSTDNIVINPGDRIAQLIVSKVERPSFAWAGGVLRETERGDKGFGSTGV